jgi:LmbE family N-acetylglucosaminyl deacetylase
MTITVPTTHRRGALAACLAVALSCGLRATDTVPDSPKAIQQELKSVATVATVLHVGAHPDDENTQLITYLARGRGYRTAYLSITRGDGGQNEIGPEFDEKLGVARTQELLAARRLDGGRQFFTRAIDFGYSKTPEETLRFWDRKEVLGDVVRVIRYFRPDVIVTRFSPLPSNTHGHHTASAILAVEAFKLAGDPSAYPEQLTQGLSVWQPKRIVVNGGGPGRGGAGGAVAGAVQMDIGGSDPVTGEAFATIAGRSRGMHKTQGFDTPGGVGGVGRPNVQSFAPLGGDAATKDLMEGIDTTWARVAGGAEIGRMADEAIAQFNTDDPSVSVPALLAIKAKLVDLAKGDPIVDDKRAQLDRILQACLGLTVETTVETPEVVPGEQLQLTTKLSVKATSVPVRFRELRAFGAAVASSERIIEGNSSSSVAQPGDMNVPRRMLRVPENLPFSQPYWLREEGAAGIFRVDVPAMIVHPENPPALPLDYVFDVGGQALVVHDEPVCIVTDAKGEHRRHLYVIPPISLQLASEVSLFTPGSTRAVSVEVTAARANTAGTVRLELPTEWKASPASQPFRLAAAGDKANFTFQVTAPARAASGRVTASAEVNGKRYSNRRIVIDYPHIPLQLLQPPAQSRLVSVAFEAKGKNVGYVAGAGDDTVWALEQLGYRVTSLGEGRITTESLRGLDAVVIGVRAFNERKDLAAAEPALWSFVENGGTVVAQYNRPSNALPPLGPYPLSIQGQAPALRVTDETAAVKFLQPDHPALTTPNKIGDADFAGWVQERGAYFPSSWDKEHYVSILAMSDPGETQPDSSVLIARHGKGYYVYTSLAFFRQLPKGVPGAYRLFANLVSLGK